MRQDEKLDDRLMKSEGKNMKKRMPRIFILGQRRGQVTAFIIIGIVLLITVGTVIYVVNQREKVRIDVDVSKEVEPVVSYIEDCVLDIATDGVISLGAQGGYVYIPEDETGIRLLNPHPNALDVFGNGKLYVPYWFYKTENGLQKEQVPTIDSMEREMERYIGENIYECVANFSNFVGYEIEGFSDVKTEVDIKDKRIIISVETPTTVTFRDVTQQVDRFGVVLEIGLGSTYKKAKEIYDKETEEMFLEKRTIDMMVLYDEIPFSGTDFDCGVKIWAVDNVKTKFREIVEYNIGAVGLKKNNMEQKEKYFALGVEKDGFDVGMMYSREWPFHMDVYPSENGLMRGDDIVKQTGQRFMSTILCINNYHFIYDVTYPVLVSLRDEKGNIFQFAYVVVIDNNQERENKLSRESIELGPDICSRKTNKVTVDTLSIGDSGQVVDIGGADIYFKCFSTKCYIGRTGIDGSLTALFPQCLNGMITGEKEGYFAGKNFVSTNVELSTSVLLEPVYDIEYEVKVINEKDGSIKPVSAETVLLELSYLDDEDYQVSSVYPDFRNIELITGDYHVKAYLLKQGSDLKLESHIVKKCVRVPKPGILGLLLTEEKCVDVNIEGGDVDSLIIGGAEFDWSVPREELVDKSKIVFYVMKSGEPKNLEDVNEIYEKIGRYESDINFLYPDFVKNEN